VRQAGAEDHDRSEGDPVNTADVAIIAIAVSTTVLGLANVWVNYQLHMRVADRVRVVNPVKAPEARDDPKGDDGGAGTTAGGSA
jgi:hypothetical protein